MMLLLLLVGGLHTARASFFPTPAPQLQTQQKLAAPRFLELQQTLDAFTEAAREHLPQPKPDLVVVPNWDDPRVNAVATRTGNLWEIHVYGGLLQHPELTDDEVLLVLCHELGHHLGGAPLASRTGWAASEGQADYWSGQNCGHLLRSPHQTALRLTQMYASSAMQPTPDLATTDTTKVERTYFGYPSPQCRLDTLVAGFRGQERPRCWYRPTEKALQLY